MRSGEVMFTGFHTIGYHEEFSTKGLEEAGFRKTRNEMVCVNSEQV
jgi:hypothetical protein